MLTFHSNGEALRAELVLPHQLEGTFQGRRKRFFADISLDGETVVAHLANTGSMRSLLVPGSKAFLTQSNDPKRKLLYSLEALQLPCGTFACVNTQQNIMLDIYMQRKVAYKNFIND